jgi:hypothetical protein
LKETDFPKRLSDRLRPIAREKDLRLEVFHSKRIIPTTPEQVPGSGSKAWKSRTSVKWSRPLHETKVNEVKEQGGTVFR